MKATCLLSVCCFLFALVLPGAPARGQITTYLKQECPGATVRYLDEEGQRKPTESDFACNSGTEARVGYSDPDNVVQRIHVPLKSGSFVGGRIPLDITFKPGKTGKVVVTVEFRDRQQKCWVCGCEWEPWKVLFKYSITVGEINPGGTLTNNSYQRSGKNYIVPTNDPATTLALIYKPDARQGGNISQVEAWVVTPTDSVHYGILPYLGFSTLFHQATEFGDYTFGTRILDKCGVWHEGPTRTVKLVPDCFDDTEVRPTVSGPNLKTYPEGYRVDAGQAYTLSFPSDSRLLDFYELTQDGGEGLTLSQNRDSSFTFSVSEPIGSYRLEFVKKASIGDYCSTLEPVNIFVGGQDATLKLNCSITLPEDLALEFGYRPEQDPNQLVLQHFAATIKSKKKIIVKPGIVLESGAELFLEYTEPGLPPDEPDLDRNFTELITYDDYGQVTGAQRSYFDARGRAIQTQSKTLAGGAILASERRYDAYDRPALHTLPAPLTASEVPGGDADDCPEVPGEELRFAYRDDFAPYPPERFDLNKRLNPDPMPGSEPGTLGWYYGNGNGQAPTERLNEPLTAHTDYPYSRTLYAEDGSGRVLGTTRPGDAHKPGSGKLATQDPNAVDEDDVHLSAYLALREQAFSLPAPTVRAGQFTKQVATDEDGRKSEVYLDRDGQAIITLYYGIQPGMPASSPILKSYQFYNLRGQLIASLTPNGVAQHEQGVPYADLDKTTYAYNWKGFLTQMSETDAGRTDYRYARDGRLRFSQNAEQRSRGAFSYTHYDETLRPVESGEYAPGGAGTTFDSEAMNKLLNERSDQGRLSGGSYRSVTTTVYDEAIAGLGRQQQFVMGAVSSTSYTPDGTLPSVSSYYSYDERGRLTWLLQDIPALGDASTPSEKLLEYRYGPQGNVQEVAYQRGEDDQYYHYFAYDADSRLFKVFSGTTAPTYNAQQEITNREVLTQQAYYSYYLHGPLKRLELSAVHQGLDYTYTVDGKLKALNGASQTLDPGKDYNDVFGTQLDYHANDFASSAFNPTSVTTGTAQYSGNIRAQQWHNPVDGHQSKAYGFAYDQRQQLQQATFGAVNTTGGSFTTSQDYRLSGLTYDKNGNIEALRRSGEQGQTLHDLTYYYAEHTNRLDSVYHQGSLFGKYAYDAVGRLVHKQEQGEDFYYAYNALNLVTGVFADEARKSQPVLVNTYDDRGFRLSKTLHDSTYQESFTIWYVRDAAGQEVSVYVDNEQDTTPAIQYEVPLYGSSRLGMYRPVEQLSLYEVKDQLGSVRAVVGGRSEESFLATAESERAGSGAEPYNEEDYFTDIKRVTVADHLNHTLDNIVAGADEAIRINNDQDETTQPIGTALMREVFAGDTLSAEVYVKYEYFPEGSGSSLTVLSTYLAGAFGLPATGEGAFLSAGNAPLSALMATGLAGQPEDVPRAGLGYLLFDRDLQLVDQGWAAVTTDARIPQDEGALTNHPFERLALENVPVQEAGFVYFFVANYDLKNISTFFDDFAVQHSTTGVLYAADHMPFGLKMSGRTIERTDYRYGYQGEWSEEEEETDELMFELRAYSPILGRFLTVDPARQFASPYLGMGNNPANSIDPDGGQCYDADGNPMTCPDTWQHYEGPDNHIRFLADVEVSAGMSQSAASASRLGMYRNSDKFWDHEVTQATMFVAGLLTGSAEAHLLGRLGTATKFLGNALKVNRGPVRQAYERTVRELGRVGDDMLSNGYSEEVTAQTMHYLRRRVGVIFKEQTPALQRGVIYVRNMLKYGDRLGPSFHRLRKSGKSYDAIIESASKPGGTDLFRK